MSAEKSTVAAYSASGSLTVFGVLMNDLALIVGMFFALMTFVLNWYYKHQSFKLLRGGKISRGEYESFNR